MKMRDLIKEDYPRMMEQPPDYTGYTPPNVPGTQPTQGLQPEIQLQQLQVQLGSLFDQLEQVGMQLQSPARETVLQTAQTYKTMLSNLGVAGREAQGGSTRNALDSLPQMSAP